MNRFDKQLDRLMGSVRRMPAAEPPGIPSGFAMNVARLACGRKNEDSAEEAFAVAFRWAVVTCAVVTLIMAAIGVPAVMNPGFSANTAYESHISELVWSEGE